MLNSYPLLLQTKNLGDSLVHIDSLISFSYLAKDSVSTFVSNTPVSLPFVYQEIENTNSAQDWLSLVIIGLLIYFVIIRFVSGISIGRSLHALLKIQNLDSVSFENQTKATAYILSPLSIFTYSFYLYYFIDPLYLKLDLEYSYFIFAILIVALFAIKSLLEKFISVIFNTNNTFSIYFTDHLFTLGVSSMLQTPFIILFVYSQQEIFIWISLSILILLWLFRLLRGLVIGFRQTNFSKSYIFLYLCSLEILPIIIVIKLLDI